MNEESVSVVFLAKEINSVIEKNIRLLEKDLRVLETVLLYAEPVSAARQLALETAKGEYILWVDADIELQSNPLDVLMELVSEPKVAGAGCCSRIEPNNWKNVFQRVHEELGVNGKEEVFDSTAGVFECGLFDAKKLRETGGFDRKMIAGEDNYAALKLNRAGYRVLKTRRAVVKHHYSPHNHFRKTWNYGAGLKKLQEMFGRDYDSSEGIEGSFVEKWVKRIKVLKKLGALHSLPLMPFYNLYIGYAYRKGYESGEFR